MVYRIKNRGRNSSYRTTVPANRPKFDDDDVGTLVMISMFTTVVFFLLQILIIIPGVIILLLMESHGWDKKTIDFVTNAFLISMELLLLIILAKKGRDSFKGYRESRREEIMDGSDTNPDRRFPAFTEKQLEYTLGIAACCGIAWCFMLQMEIMAIKYLLIVLEGAAFLFLSIFVIIRFLLTRKVRLFAVACIILTGFSLWALSRRVLV